MRSRTGMGPSSPFLDLVLLISLPRGGGVLRQGGWGGEGELDAESNLSKLWRRVYHTISAIRLPMVLHFMFSWFLNPGCAVGHVGALNLPHTINQARIRKLGTPSPSRPLT